MALKLYIHYVSGYIFVLIEVVYFNESNCSKWFKMKTVHSFIHSPIPNTTPLIILQLY